MDGSQLPVDMDPDEMRLCLDAIGWSQRDLAKMLGSNESNVRQMARGRRRVPDELATWLRLLAAFHNAHPLPLEWRGRSDGDDD